MASALVYEPNHVVPPHWRLIGPADHKGVPWQILTLSIKPRKPRKPKARSPALLPIALDHKQQVPLLGDTPQRSLESIISIIISWANNQDGFQNPHQSGFMDDIVLTVKMDKAMEILNTEFPLFDYEWKDGSRMQDGKPERTTRFRMTKYEIPDHMVGYIESVELTSQYDHLGLQYP